MTSSAVYATAEEVFASFGQHSQDDKPQVNRLLAAISRAIDGYMGRPEYGFVALDTALAVDYAGIGERYLYTAEFIGTAAVTMKTSLSSSTFDFTFLTAEIQAFRGDYRTPTFHNTPNHGIQIAYNARRHRFTSGWYDGIMNPTVRISAKWGYATTVPSQIKEATIMMAERIYKRERAGMGDAVYNEQLGAFGFFKELDPEVKLFLDRTRLKLPTRIK